MLQYCDDPSIQHILTSEIIDGVNELSLDRFGSYIVQVKHGDAWTVMNIEIIY